MLSTTGKTLAIACTAAAALAVSITPAASAKGGDGTRVAGVCSGPSTSVLKAKHGDGGLEVEFEVDQNRSQVPWNVQLMRNGKTAFAGTRTTGAPSGSFTVVRRLAAGSSPVIRARATRNGETCTATLIARSTAATPAASAPAPAASATGVKLRGDGTIDDNSVAAPAPAQVGTSGPGADDAPGDNGHHGSPTRLTDIVRRTAGARAGPEARPALPPIRGGRFSAQDDSAGAQVNRSAHAAEGAATGFAKAAEAADARRPTGSERTTQ